MKHPPFYNVIFCHIWPNFVNKLHFSRVSLKFSPRSPVAHYVSPPPLFTANFCYFTAIFAKEGRGGLSLMHTVFKINHPIIFNSKREYLGINAIIRKKYETTGILKISTQNQHNYGFGILIPQKSSLSLQSKLYFLKSQDLPAIHILGRLRNIFKIKRY